MELTKLGFISWFREKFKMCGNSKFIPARISAVDKNSFMAVGPEGEMTAEITGKLRFEAETSLDYPTVGDWVAVESFNNDTFAVIHCILPRKSLLKRKTPGKKIDYQLLASNIDAAFIMQSLDSDFNLRRLERYLSMVYEGGIAPFIILSKADLISSDELKKKLGELKRINIKCKTLVISSKTGAGLKRVGSLIKHGRTYCLIGSSGVGKTTLINNLIGVNKYMTGEVKRSDGKGKHITTRRQLIILDKGGIIIDTPGLRELGNISVEAGMAAAFPEISDFSENCRFADCTHTHEPGCAVLEAVENGRIQADRLKSYNKLKKESEYHSLSYMQKREKDRKFGRFIKKVLKNHKKTI